MPGCRRRRRCVVGAAPARRRAAGQLALELRPGTGGLFQPISRPWPSVVPGLSRTSPRPTSPRPRARAASAMPSSSTSWNRFTRRAEVGIPPPLDRPARGPPRRSPAVPAVRRSENCAGGAIRVPRSSTRTAVPSAVEHVHRAGPSEHASPGPARAGGRATAGRAGRPGCARSPQGTSILAVGDGAAAADRRGDDTPSWPSMLCTRESAWWMRSSGPAPQSPSSWLPMASTLSGLTRTRLDRASPAGCPSGRRPATASAPGRRRRRR